MMLSRLSPADKPSSLPPRMLVATGLLLIAGGLAWPKATALHGTMSLSDVDFIQGVLLGIGIACEVMGVGRILGAKRNTGSSTTPRD